MDKFVEDMEKDYIGTVAYTLGDNTSLTAGVYSQAVGGLTNQIALGGQVSISAPLNASATFGNYVEAIWGNNITYAGSQTLNMTSGENLSYQDNSRMQAKTYVEMGAGITAVDQPIWELLEASVAKVKTVLKLLFASNLVLGSVGAAAATTDNSSSHTFDESKARMWTDIGTVSTAVLGNAGAMLLLNSYIKTIAKYFGQIQHVSNIIAASDHIEIDADFSPDALTPTKSYLFINQDSLKLAKEVQTLNTTGSSITFEDSSSEWRFVYNSGLLKYRKFTTDASGLVLSTGTTESTLQTTVAPNAAGRRETTVDWTDATPLWQLRVGDQGVTASGGAVAAPVSLAMRNASMVASVGQNLKGMMSLSDQSAALAFGTPSQGFGVNISAIGVEISPKDSTANFKLSTLGIEASGNLIQLG